jgi:multiple sugar transport system substrate-binding protein
LYFYNKDILRKAGVAFPSNNWDLHQFLQTAQQLQKSKLAQIRPGFYAFGGEGIFPGVFDAHILSSDLSHSVINSNQYVQAMQFNKDLKERYKVSPGLSSGIGSSDKNQAFQLGNLAMMTGATWDIPIMQRDASKIDWDVVLPPRGVKRAIWGSSSGVCVFSRTPHSQQSVTLLEYLISPKLQLQICHNSGCIPTDRAAASQWADGIVRPQHIQNFLNAIPYLEPSPRSVALSEITSKVSRAGEKVMMGRATPRAALDDANSQIDKIIERQNRLLGHDVNR